MGSHVPQFATSKTNITFYALTDYLSKRSPSLDETNNACSSNTQYIPSFAKYLYCSISSFLYGIDAMNGYVSKENSITHAYPYANMENITFARILSYIKGNISELTGDFNKNDIAIAIATATDEPKNKNLISSLAIDFNYLSTPANEIQSTILNKLTGRDATSMSVSLYSILDWPWISNIQGPVTLSKVISRYITRNDISGSQVATNIQDAIASLTGDFTLNDIADKIVEEIGATNNGRLIDLLRLDINALANQDTFGDRKTALEIQEQLANITGWNGPSIANSIYSDLEYTWATSIPGLMRLSRNIGYEHDNNIEYSQILSNIKGNVSALTGNFTNNDITKALVTSIESTDERLNLRLETDMDTAYHVLSITPNDIAASLANITGNDAPEIATNIYDSWDWGDGYLGIKGLDKLTNALDHAMEHNVTNLAEDITNNIQELHGNFTLDDIALIISATIERPSNKVLTTLLALDIKSLEISPLEVQELLSNITGTDAPSIATSVYNALYWSGASNIQGLTNFMQAVNSYERSDNVPIFELAIYKLQESIGDLYLNMTTPNFNLCYLYTDVEVPIENSTNNEEDIFIVSSPVFSYLDVNPANIYEVLVLCAQIAEYIGFAEVYITKEQPIGVIGNAEETGCHDFYANNLMNHCRSAFVDDFVL